MSASADAIAVAVRDQTGRQVERGRDPVPAQHGQHRVVEVAIAVVERDHDPATPIAGEDVVERQHALGYGQVLHLPRERVGRQARSRRPRVLRGGTAGRRRHPAAGAPATPGG